MSWLVGFLAKSALMQSPVGAFIRWVPKWAWIVLAVVAAVAGAYLWHQHVAGKALKSADAAGYARAKAEDAKALQDLRSKANEAASNGRSIAQDTRSKNDETNRAAHAAAGDLLVRGAGASRSRCVGDPAVPAASGEHGAAPDAAHVARALLSDDDRTADRADVPWRWLVGRAEQSDLDRAEVVAWRSWYQRQADEWNRLYGAKPGQK
jgi:hypothetical protein